MYFSGIATGFMAISFAVATPLALRITASCKQISTQQFLLDILALNMPVADAKALILMREFGRFSHEYFY